MKNTQGLQSVIRSAQKAAALKTAAFYFSALFFLHQIQPAFSQCFVDMKPLSFQSNKY